MKTLTRWPVTVSYYDRDAKTKEGEQTPVYAMSFELFENGVSRALVLDYNDFRDRGRDRPVRRAGMPSPASDAEADALTRHPGAMRRIEPGICERAFRRLSPSGHPVTTPPSRSLILSASLLSCCKHRSGRKPAGPG